MAVAKVQVRFARTSLLPEDVVVNTFHFFVSGTTVSAANAATITQKVIDFYKRPALPGSAITQFISQVISRSQDAHEVRVYDMGNPIPRQPITSTFFSILSANSTTVLPSEVAIVLSLKAPVPIGGNPKRYRGRLYIGPLTTNVLGSSENGDVRIPSGTRQQLLDAAVGLMAGAAETIAWGIWSEVDQELRRITSAYVDDAFDTQRRRGSKSSERTTIAEGGGV